MATTSIPIGVNPPVDSTGTNNFRSVLEIKTLPVNKSFILLSDGYKKWVEGIEEIQTSEVPVMTSNTSPSGEASASSFQTGYEPFNAFDSVVSFTSAANGWISVGGTTTGWLRYKFVVPKAMIGYKIMPQVVSPLGNLSEVVNRCPKDWTFEASNDGLQWTVLDTRSGESTWSVGAFNEYRFQNSTPYQEYRINVTLNNGSTQYVGIGEMQLMSSIIPSTPAYWETISTTLPDENTFISEGMDDLSVFNRKSTTFNYDLVASGVIGDGKMFKQTIDLKKLIEIEKIRSR